MKKLAKLKWNIFVKLSTHITSPLRQIAFSQKREKSNMLKTVNLQAMTAA